MASFAHMKLDFYDDPSFLRDETSVPEFVKQAKVGGVNSLEKVAERDFALVIITPDGSVLPKYPVHTPADTWLSLKAFEKNAHKLPIRMQETAANNLGLALEKWAMLDTKLDPTFYTLIAQNTNKSNVVEVKTNDEYFQLSVKTASDMFDARLEKSEDLEFGVVTKDASGNKIRKYPMHNEEYVKKADAWFAENYQTLHPELRHQFADKLVRNAYFHGVKLANNVALKYAGDDYSPHFEAEVRSRRQLVLDDTELHLLDDVLEKKAAMAPDECAKVLQAIDVRLGLDKYWDSHISDPYATVFALPKLADYSYDDGNSRVSGEDIRSFTKRKNFRETLQAYVSKEIIDELESNPVEVFESLPKPEKRLIVDLMKE